MLHDLIAAAIDRSGIPVAELARRIGVSRAAVYRWTAGESIPRSDHLAKLLQEVQAPRRVWSAALDAAAEGREE